MVMGSYVPKKGKSVILLNSMHDDKVVDDGVKRKRNNPVLQQKEKEKST